MAKYEVGRLVSLRFSVEKLFIMKISEVTTKAGTVTHYSGRLYIPVGKDDKVVLRTSRNIELDESELK